RQGSRRDESDAEPDGNPHNDTFATGLTGGRELQAQTASFGYGAFGVGGAGNLVIFRYRGICTIRAIPRRTANLDWSQPFSANARATHALDISISARDRRDPHVGD